MKATIYSKAVKNEIEAINEASIHAKVIKKRNNIELIAAVGTIAAIVIGFIILNHFGLIREF